MEGSNILLVTGIAVIVYVVLGTSFIVTTIISLIMFVPVLYLINRPKPFHVKMEPLEMKVGGINIFPLIHFIYLIIPDQLRRYLSTKQNAPAPNKRLRDRFVVKCFSGIFNPSFFMYQKKSKGHP